MINVILQVNKYKVGTIVVQFCKLGDHNFNLIKCPVISGHLDSS